jgi:hypothetical protein
MDVRRMKNLIVDRGSGIITSIFFLLFLLSFFFTNSRLAGGCSELLLQLVSLAVVDLGGVVLYTYSYLDEG